jgi:hypothetical protein
MKKTLIVALMMVAGVAQAAVPCIVNPTSSVYHVDTYIRMQSACVKTAPAVVGGSAGAALGATVGFLGAVVAFVQVKQFIENNKEENKWLIYEIEWADGNKDLIKVRAENGDFKEASQKIRAKFANAATPIKSLSWVSLGQPVVDMIIE